METPICQIALSVVDLARSRSWYRQLGLEPSGVMGPLSGDLPARMLDLPELEVQINWLLGRDSMSQLELIHFSRPQPRPRAKYDLRHAGYGVISLVVADFEKVLRQLCGANAPHTITGAQGSRSIWIEDPDAIPLEIMEKDPLGLGGSAGDDGGLTSIRAVSLTVGDLQRARRYWTAAVGLSGCPRADCAFNSFPENLGRGVGGWEEQLLKGGSFVLRLLKPRDGAIIPRSAGYRLSDAGVLNIAAIVDDRDSYKALLDRVRRLGYTFTTAEPMEMGDAGTIYGYDDQGVSVEIGFVLPGSEVKYGWRR